MVCRLCRPCEFLENLSGPLASGAHRRKEFSFSYVCRAGTGNEDTAGSKACSGQLSEPGVGADGAGALGFTPGQRRRIENEQPELLVGARKPLKRIPLNKCRS